MKRKLSLLLAVVMILGTFSFAFADDDFDVPAFLEKEGILKGNTKGDLMLDEPLLRKDAVVLLARLLKAEDEAEAFEKEGLPTFNDLAGNPYYNAFLAWAEDNGYFTGKPDGSFGYEDNLEAVEYALVLLRALGYVNEDKAAEWDEAWDTAKKLGLLEDVKAERREEILRKEVAQMTFNALGVKMKDSDKTLAEFLGITMPDLKPTELTAKVLDTENLAEIVVELSNVDLVKNKDALLNPANYRLSNDAKVQNVHLDGDNVVLTLVPYGKVEEQGKFDSLVKGKKFDLTIRNIDPAINKTYKGILANDNAIPVVENVEFMGTHGIKVTTSEPIANPLERNFRLDSRTSMIVEQYGRDIILTPYHSREFDKDAVELTIDKLEDFAGYTSVRTVEPMELSTDDALPEVEAAYRSGKELVVVFDRDVYHDSIKPYENRRDLGNVSFVERRVTFYAEEADKIDTNVVKYTFKRDIPRNIEVEIEGVANHFNKAMEKTSIVPEEYKDDFAPVVISSTSKVKVTKAVDDVLEGMKDEERKEKINEGYLVETQEMTITFDKDIAEFKDAKPADINVKDHFTLYELDITRRGEAAAKDVQIKVTSVDKDKIKLTFKDIKLNNKDRDYDYILEVRDFSDLNRNRMERDYLDFQVVRIDKDFNVEIKDIRNTSYFNRKGVEIVLEFNDYVDKEEGSNARNYYLDGKLDVDEAIVERDGKTVSLVVYDTDVAKLLKDYKVLEISPRVTILGDDDVPANRFFDLATKEAIGGPQAKDPAITYIAAPVDGEVLVTDVAATEEAIKITPQTGDNYEVYTVAGAIRTKVTPGTVNVYTLAELGLTATDIDLVNKDVKVEVYNNGALVDTVVFSTKDITGPTVSAATLTTQNVLAAKATLAVSNNTGLTVTAKEAGAAGNGITFSLVDGTPEAVVVTGTAIVVTADITNGATQDDVVALVEENAKASALVDIASTSGTTVAAVNGSVETLSGGLDPVDAVITLTVADTDMDTSVTKVDVVIAGKTYEAAVAYSAGAVVLTIDGEDFTSVIAAGQTIVVNGLKDVNGNAAVFLVGGLV